MIEEKGKVSVKDLVKIFDILEVSICYDFNELGKCGLVVCLCGGVIVCDKFVKEFLVKDKYNENYVIKV